EFLEVEHKTALNPNSEFLFEAWIRPENLNNDFALVKKGAAYQVVYNSTAQTFEFSIQHNGANVSMLSADASEINSSNYNHLAFELHNDSLKYFLNGEFVDSEFAVNECIIDPNNDNIIIG